MNGDSRGEVRPNGRDSGAGGMERQEGTWEDTNETRDSSFRRIHFITEDFIG